MTIPVARPFIGMDELESIGKVFKTGWLGMGSLTYKFEEEIIKFIGCDHVIAVNTGTSAIHIALDCFGIGQGDEVIIPSITYAAGVQAILATGATPVFCESQKADLLIDIDDVMKKLSDRTKAVMPVHYCGQACDMDSLLNLADKHNFWVIEDAAHAFGSTFKGRRIGSFGHATCFSFDPIKVVTAGEGGAVTVQDEGKAELLRRKRILGIDKETWHRYKNNRSWFYQVTTNGFRYHMPNFCAAIGIEQIKKVEDFISRRRKICLKYDSAFKTLKSIKTLKVDYSETAPFMYLVRILNGERDSFINSLKDCGVDTGIHYIPNHIHPYFKKYAQGPLKVSSELGEQIVTLPLFYALSDSDIDKVIDAVLNFEKSFYNYKN